MIASLLITLREGVEAALIVGIVITYLIKINYSCYIKTSIYGVIIAIVASALTAWFFEGVLGGFKGKSEEIFEGVIIFIAVCVLTYMVVWMHHQAKYIAAGIRHKIDLYISRRHIYGLGFLCFLAVYREGVETVLFFAALGSVKTAASWLGGTLGVISAILLAFIFFTSAKRFSLRHFFQVTGVLLVLIAAGLFARGIHELQEAEVIPLIKEHIFDINPYISYQGTEKLNLLILDNSWENKLLANDYSKKDINLVKNIINHNGAYKSKRYYKNLLDDAYIKVSTPFRLAFHEHGSIGSFLKAMFGYNPNPSLIEFTAYIVYYLFILIFIRLSRHEMDQ